MTTDERIKLQVCKHKTNRQHKNMKVVVVNETMENRSISQQLPTKIVLLLGASGHGKTSFVDSMCNYLYDVKLEDDFRLVIANQPKKETTENR